MFGRSNARGYGRGRTMRGTPHHHHHFHHQQYHHGCGGGGGSVRRGRQKYAWPDAAAAVYASVALAVAVCYWNGLDGDFVHDDIPAVTVNADVLGTGPLANVVVNDFWGTPMSDPNSHKSYRPLTTLTFRYYAFKTNNPVSKNPKCPSLQQLSEVL